MHKKLQICMSVCVVAFGASTSTFAKDEIKAGDRPPVEMKKRTDAAIENIALALDAADLERIHKYVKELTNILGPYAGIPESRETRYIPQSKTEVNKSTISTAWSQLWPSKFDQYGSRNNVASKNKIELRESGYVVIAYAAAAAADPDNLDVYTQRIKEELAYLLERQSSQGFFPYPAQPAGGSPPHIRKLVAELVASNPESVENGYINVAQSGYQFDTGICAIAMLEGYKLMGDTVYLKSAERAAKWASTFPLDKNWNYNSFSVLFLARLSTMTNNPDYLESAIQIAELGVLPGQMKSGIWVDQHNAKESYHFIMVNALAELLHAVPETHEKYSEILEKTTLAADVRAMEILNKGVGNVESATLALTTISHVLGRKPLWDNALQQIAMAMTETGKLNPIAIPLYWRYLAGE